MARRIGSVYVTVLANTRGVSKQIRDELRKSGPVVGKDWADGFNRSLRDAELSEAFSDAADKIVGEWRAKTKAMGKSVRYGIADARLAEQMEGELEAFLKSFNRALPKRLQVTMEAAANGIARSLEGALKRVEAEERRVVQDTERAIQALDKQRAAAYLKQFQDAEREQARLAAEAEKERKRRLDFADRIERTLVRQNTLGSVNLSLDQAQVALEKLMLDLQAGRVVNIRDAQVEYTRLTTIIAEQNRVLRQQSEAANRTERSMFRAATSFRDALRRAGTGGFFDNATNVLAGLTSISLVAARVARRAVEGFIDLGDAISRVGDRLSSTGTNAFTRSIGALGKTVGAAISALGPWGQAIAAAAAAVVGLVAGFQALGAVAAAISATAGVLLSLSSAATYAAGSLAALLPLAAGLGAAAATIFVGFENVPGAIKAFSAALKESDPEKKAEALERYADALGLLTPNARTAVQALEPLIKRFGDLRSAVQEKLFAGLAEEIGGLGVLFDKVEAGLLGVADTLNEAFKALSGIFREPKFLADLRKNFEGLRPIILNMTTATGNFLSGVNSLITSLLPAGETLSGWFADIAETFKGWTQSARGKNTIADFMERAFESAGKIKDILLQVGSAIGTLFSGSYGSGQSFLDALLVKAQEFADWARQVTASGQLERWLEDVREIAGDVAEVVGDIAKAFDQLDNPGTRSFLGDVITIFGDIIEAIGAIAAAIENPTWTSLGEALARPFITFADIVGSILENVPGMQGLGSALKNAADQAERLLEPKGADSAFDWAAIGLDALIALKDQGVLTNQELDFIINERDAPNFPLVLKNKLESLKTQGLITDEQLAAIVGDRTLSSWPEALAGALLNDTTTAQGTSAALATVVGNRPLPPWLQNMLVQLGSVGQQAIITQGRIAAIPNDKQVRIGITETGYNVVYGKVRSILDQNGKVVNIIIKGTSAGTGPGGPANPNSASGGLFTNPSARIIGENGPEALIPLSRPLGQVDRSVRGLAALIRQGGRGVQASQGKTAGKTVNVTMNVYPAQADPEAVAAAVMSRAVTLART
jgi:tetratricopeptide (TPR) repeat protein